MKVCLSCSNFTNPGQTRTVLEDRLSETQSVNYHLNLKSDHKSIDIVISINISGNKDQERPILSDFQVPTKLKPKMSEKESNGQISETSSESEPSSGHQPRRTVWFHAKPSKINNKLLEFYKCYQVIV